MSSPILTATLASARSNVTFSADGRRATCLRTTGTQRALELWTFHGLAARSRLIEGVPTLDPATQTLPLDDGRMLLHPNSVDVRDLFLLDPRGVGLDIHRLGTLPGVGIHLLPSPSANYLGLVISREDPDHSVIWLITADPPGIEQLVRLPGVATGGVWVDGPAGLLALNVTEAGRGTDGLLVDVADGTWTRLFSISPASTDRVLAGSSRSGLLVLGTTASGQERLGIVRIGRHSPVRENVVRFPEVLHREGHRRVALAVDECGERILIHEEHGAMSALSVYTPADDHLDRLSTPAGTVLPQASWAQGVVRVPFTAPACPSTMLSLSCGARRSYSVAAPAQTAGVKAWVDAELVELPGVDGPIETIVYGGPNWRSSEHLVLALHGGPLSSSRLEFDPLFQDLIAAGCAVAAPNYLGSVGYGYAHMRPVLGAWGGPDLDDVIRIGNHLAQWRVPLGRRPPVIFGASYGAFLALLAAATAAPLWSGCVAAAPLLSGPRLHADATTWVAQRIERLGALHPITDELGPRDVLQLCPRIQVPLLLLHGTHDETIPVEQSRMLRRRLLQLGRDEGTHFCYHEVPGDHDDVTRAKSPELRDLIVRFCGANTPPSHRQHRPLPVFGPTSQAAQSTSITTKG